MYVDDILYQYPQQGYRQVPKEGQLEHLLRDLISSDVAYALSIAIVL
jgi:hypothetical protein